MSSAPIAAPKYEQNARVRRRGHEQVGVVCGMLIIRNVIMYRVTFPDGREGLHSESALVSAGHDDRFNGKGKG